MNGFLPTKFSYKHCKPIKDNALTIFNGEYYFEAEPCIFVMAGLSIILFLLMFCQVLSHRKTFQKNTELIKKIHKKRQVCKDLNEKIDNLSLKTMKATVDVNGVMITFVGGVGFPDNIEMRTDLFTKSTPYLTFIQYAKAVCSYRIYKKTEFDLRSTYIFMYNYAKLIGLLPEENVTQIDVLSINLDELLNIIKEDTESDCEFTDDILPSFL